MQEQQASRWPDRGAGGATDGRLHVQPWFCLPDQDQVCTVLRQLLTVSLSDHPRLLRPAQQDHHMLHALPPPLPTMTCHVPSCLAHLCLCVGTDSMPRTRQAAAAIQPAARTAAAAGAACPCPLLLQTLRLLLLFLLLLGWLL